MLDFVMGKIMSCSSSMFIAMNYRMATLDEMNQMLQVIHNRGHEIKRAYANCK